MKKKNQKSRSNKYWLLGTSLVCVLLMIFSVFAEKVEGPFRGVADITVIPMQKGISQIGTWIGDVSENFETLKQLKKENKKLQKQVDELQAKNTTLSQDQEELDRLRTLYNLDTDYSEFEKVAAQVIGKDTGNWYSTFLINRGSSDGIAVDMNVIADGGLVGIVTETGAHWATVRSIIDDSSNVSAMTVSTQDNCVVEGDLELIDEGKLSFSQMYDQDNKVTVGERIVTSNISEKYVEGLFIGYVSEIQQDPNNLTKTGTIVTPVDFGHLKDVFVITTNKQDAIDKSEDASNEK